MNEVERHEYEQLCLSLESYIEMMNMMSEEERAAYWKKENARENLRWINDLHDTIRLHKRIINQAKHWLRLVVEQVEDKEKLKQDLLLGAELIQLCEEKIVETRKEIVNYTKYPLHSQKRRDWYKTQEGRAWQEKLLNQLRKN